MKALEEIHLQSSNSELKFINFIRVETQSLK